MEKIDEVLIKFNSLELKLDDSQRMILGKLTKLNDRYALPHDLIKVYLSENRLFAEARKKAEMYYSELKLLGIPKIEKLIDEFTYAEISRQKGKVLKYAFHSNMQIETILYSFCLINPGPTILIPKLRKNINSSSNLDVSDVLFKWRKGWLSNPISQIKSDFIINFTNNKINDLADKKSIFEQFLFLFKTDNPLVKIKVPGSTKCPQFNLSTFQILRYFRNLKEHPDANKPFSNNVNTQFYFDGFFNNPDLLISMPDVQNLIDAYVWLYKEYLKGKITI